VATDHSENPANHHAELAGCDFPLADPETETEAKKIFPWETSPDRYTALHAHGWYCCSYVGYRYRDETLDRFVRRFADIVLRAPGAPTLAELRVEWLTPAERAAVDKDILGCEYYEDLLVGRPSADKEPLTQLEVVGLGLVKPGLRVRHAIFGRGVVQELALWARVTPVIRAKFWSGKTRWMTECAPLKRGWW
jgi:hypothetical protein